MTQASRAAIAAVEAAGGRVVSVYHTPLALRALLKPHRVRGRIQMPRPPPKKMAYYTNYRNRGYLSSRLQLEALKENLAAGAPAPSLLVPVFVGGKRAEAADGLAIPPESPWAPVVTLPRAVRKAEARAAWSKSQAARAGGGAPAAA